MMDNELIYLDALNKLLKSNMSELPSDLKPKTREEFYLEQIFKNIAGVSSELPTDLNPQDRKEVLLAVIEQNSRDISVGGGGGGGGVLPPEIDPDEWGQSVMKWIEVVPTRNISAIGRVDHSAEVVQSKVADDVWFGNNKFNDYVNVEHEKFEYNKSILHLDNSELVFIPANNETKDIPMTERWLHGDLSTLVLDNTETDTLELATIKPTIKRVVNNTVTINADNFSATEGYNIRNGIEIVTIHHKESDIDVVTDDNYTYATIEIDSNEFNDIKELQ